MRNGKQVCGCCNDIDWKICQTVLQTSPICPNYECNVEKLTPRTKAVKCMASNLSIC